MSGNELKLRMNEMLKLLTKKKSCANLLNQGKDGTKFRLTSQDGDYLEVERDSALEPEIMELLSVIEGKTIERQLDLLLSSIDYLYVHLKELQGLPKH